MTLLEQTIAERARAHLAGVQAFYAKAKAGTAVEDALLELRHWRDSGMSDAGRDALLSVEIEAAKALRDYCA